MENALIAIDLDDVVKAGGLRKGTMTTLRDKSIREHRTHGGSHILVSLLPPDWQHGPSDCWRWNIAVDGVVGDRCCHLSDGMRRMWYAGTGAYEDDCRRQIEQRLSIQPVSYRSIDVGFDPRLAKMSVELRPSPDAVDNVVYAIWEGGEMLASVHAVSAAMRKAGYHVVLAQ